MKDPFCPCFSCTEDRTYGRGYWLFMLHYRLGQMLDESLIAQDHIKRTPRKWHLLILIWIHRLFAWQLHRGAARELGAAYLTLTASGQDAIARLYEKEEKQDEPKENREP